MQINKIIFTLVLLGSLLSSQGCNYGFYYKYFRSHMDNKNNIFETFHIAYFPSNLPIIDMEGPIYSIEEGYYLGKVDILKDGKAIISLVSDFKKKKNSKYERGYDLLFDLSGINFKNKFCQNSIDIASKDYSNFKLCLYEAFEFKMTPTLRVIDSSVGERYFKNKKINSKNRELQNAIRFKSVTDWKEFRQSVILSNSYQ